MSYNTIVKSIIKEIIRKSLVCNNTNSIYNYALVEYIQTHLIEDDEIACYYYNNINKLRKKLTEIRTKRLSKTHY